MGLRDPNETALKDACRDVADQNLGYVYADSQTLRNKVKESYREHDDVSITDSKTVAEEDITAIMEKDKKAEKIGTETYFISPFSRASVEPYEILIPRLLNVFSEENWFVSENDLMGVLVKGEEIAPDDFDALLNELAERDPPWIIETGGYFKPGETIEDFLLSDNPAEQLRSVIPQSENGTNSESDEIAELEDEIEETTTGVESLETRLEGESDDGLLTVSDIQRELSIKTTEQFIQEELIDSNILYRLENNKFFVNNPRAVESRIRGEISPNSTFVDSIEREMRKNDFIFTEEDLERWLIDNISETSSETRMIIEHISEDYREDVISHATEEFKNVAEVELEKREAEDENPEYIPEKGFPFSTAPRGKFYVSPGDFEARIETVANQKLTSAANDLNTPPGDDSKILNPAIAELKQEKENPGIHYGATLELEAIFINLAIDECWRQAKNKDLWESIEE